MAAIKEPQPSITSLPQAPETHVHSDASSPSGRGLG